MATPVPAQHLERAQRRGPTPSEWEIERLDVGAYLDRIGYAGSLEPSPEVLTALHRAHATTIPFENLDIILGRGVSLRLDDIQEKLLRQRRGGYCYEHNLLFAALLERMEFDVRRLVARVQPDKPGPRTHMLLNVTIDGEEWLADVGFGAALLDPIPLDDGIEVRQGEWTHGTARMRDGSWRLRTRDGEEWSDLYGFTGEPQRPTDYLVYNHYTSTHPGSPFVSQVVAMRVTPAARFTLRSDELTTTRPDGSSVRTTVPGPGLDGVLRDTFGIALNGDDALAMAGTLLEATTLS
jgi:N-hydroxyarylamine O-acetyltransferase